MAPNVNHTWPTPPHWSDPLGPRPLVMITTSYPSPKAPISGHFVQDLARLLHHLGHEVTVYTPAGSITPPTTCIEHGVHVVRVPSPLHHHAPFHTAGLPDILEEKTLPILSALSVPIGLSSLLLRIASDLHNLPKPTRQRTHLIGHWLTPGGTLSQLLASAFQLQATTICHSGAVRLLTQGPQTLTQPLIRFSLGRGPFIATCNELVTLLETTLGTSLQHRAHIAPMPAAALSRHAPPPTPEPFHLLTLARLVPVKNLDAFAHALQHAPFSYVWHICGDGPERAPLQTLCENLGVSAHFHGLVTGATKERILSQAHAFILPSKVLSNGRTEGSPVALREAIQYTLPILATSVGGVPDVLATYPHATLCDPSISSLTSGLHALHLTMSSHWAHLHTP